MSAATTAFGLPASGSGGGVIPGQGLFSVPNSIQRVYEFALFSTYRFPAATNLNVNGDARLFQVPIQSTGQGFSSPMSISDTNMRVGAIAPGDSTYEVSAIAAEIFGATSVAPLVADIRLLQRVLVLFWEFGTLVLPVAPLSMIGAGSGIFGATGDTGTPTTFANNGNGSALWCYQRVVVSIPATQQFNMQLQVGNAGQGSALAPTADTQIRLNLFNQARQAVPIA